MHLHGLDDLVTDGVDGGQRRQRVLEDHRELVAAQPRHAPRRSRPSSSSPCSLIDPVILAVAGCRPMIASEVTDLPEPDSPTIAMVSPAAKVEGQAADGADRSGLGRERDVQVGDLQHGPGRGPADLGRLGQAAVIVRTSDDADDRVESIAQPVTHGVHAEHEHAPPRPPGPVNSQGKLLICRAPSPSSVPREVSGAWTPKPKKDSPVSARIAAPTLRVASMINSEEMLGRMCRTMVLGRGQAHELGGLDVLALLDRHRQAADHPGRQHPGEGGQQHAPAAARSTGPSGRRW